jgi:hypothetical protein
MTERDLLRIINQNKKDEIQLSRAYADGGTQGLWGRFERAAGNQMCEGKATLARYGIWANTVRDTAHLAYRKIDEGKIEEAQTLLIQVINSLSAFSDVQREMDSIDW